MDKQLKILIVNRAMGTLFGGGESFDLNAARYLTKRGHKVTVITAEPLLKKPLEYSDINLVYVSSPNLRRYAYLSEHINRKLSAAIRHLDNWLFEKQVFRWLSKGGKHKQFDVVQCHGLLNLPRWIVSQWQMPVVMWLPGPPSGLSRKAIKKLVRKAHFGLFARGATVEVLQSQMGLTLRRDFFVVEPGIELAFIDNVRADREKLRNEFGIPDNSLIGITVCRLIPVKNVSFLIHGIGEVLKQGANYHWLIVGDGPEKERLEKLAQELGVISNIHFFGYQPNPKVHQLLAISDVYALTSSYESFSISTLEAMAHRLPVIATKVGYLQIMVRESGGGILVPPNDIDALADALVKLAFDADLRRKLGKQGRAYAERFDWPVITEKLEGVYEYVISKKG